MKTYFHAQTDNGATPPIVDPLKAVEDAKAGANKSITDIVDKAFSPEIITGNTQIPLGDAAPPAQPVIKPPTEPMVTQGEIFKNIDELNQDIDTAQLEGAKSPESIRSFDGLKARYKNKTKAIRDQVQSLHTQVTALTSQLEGIDKLKEGAKKYEEVAPTVSQLEEKVKTLDQENKTLNYFRRKYDLENDPTIKDEFITPMNDLQAKSMDIIENNHLEADLWDKLIAADSEFQVNTLIDSSRITGLNAQSLKRYVGLYQQLRSGYNEVSSPQNIEAAIDTAKGARLRNAAEMSTKMFDKTQATFAEWISELKESDFNKEYNHFVYDKVVDQAKTNYENLKKVLPADQISPVTMHSMAKAALMAAAYPVQKTMLEHALKIIGDLTTEIKEGGAPRMRQTKEAPMSTQAGSIEDLKQGATKTIDQIAAESFSNRLS